VTVASVLAVCGLTSGVAHAAPASLSPAMSVPAASNGQFIAAIADTMPSLQDQFTNKELISLAHSYCKALKAGSTVRQIDRLTRKYLADDESMALIGLSVAAYCERYWPKVSSFYDLGN
jgi:hypothetical protein